MYKTGIYIKILLLAGWVTLALSSCLKENTDIGPGPTGDGKVTLTLNTNVTDYAAPVTRAAEDYIGNTPLVLVFKGTDGDAVLTEIVQSTFNGTNTVVTVTKSDFASRFVVIANAPTALYDGSVPAYITNLETSLSGCKLSELETKLRTGPLSIPSVASKYPYSDNNDAIPMSGLSDIVPKIDQSTTITNGSNKMTLKRMVAKVQVSADPSLSNLTLDGAAVFNAMNNGALYRYEAANTPIVASSGSKVHYFNSDGTDIKSGAGITEPFYIYEASPVTDGSGNLDHSNTTMIIVKAQLNGVTNFYKLGFIVDNVPIDIVRNMDYHFTMTVAEPGYTTMTECLNNAPISNLNYTIKVTDGTAHDIISNGKYYLGLSNSAVTLCGEGQADLTNAVIVTTDLHNDMPGNILVNKITPSAGITLLQPSSGIIDIGANSSAGATFTPVSIRLSNTFQTGTIQIELGELTQTVTVRRDAPVGFSGRQELSGDAYLSYDIEDRGVGNWLSMSVDGENESEHPSQALRAPGKLYIMAPPNVVQSGGTPRTGGELYVSSRNGAGIQYREKNLSYPGSAQNR